MKPNRVQGQEKETRGGDQSSVTKKDLFIKNNRRQQKKKTSIAETLEVMTRAHPHLSINHTYSTYISLLILARGIALSVE
jgi:hypothetical protein